MKIGYDAKRIFHNTTGLGNYSRDLVRIMAHYYPDNQYYLYNPKNPKVKRLKIQPNMLVKQPESFFFKAFPSLWRSKFILKDLQRDNIEIFHGLSAELPAGIEKTPVKAVVTIHDLIFQRFPELYKPIDRKIYYKKFLSAVQNATQVVAISEQTKNDIIQFGNLAPEQIKVIYQGCHQVFKESYSSDEKQEVKQKYNLPDEYLLNVGTLEPRKNALSIVQAIKDTNYPLVLVGRKTPYARHIEKYILENHMQEQVIFLEGMSLKELALIYQSARMLVYPSFFEGFGIPIIEALYSKIPVITNKNGVFPEAAGPYSYYINDVNNPAEIRKKIDEVWTNNNDENIRKSYEFVQRFNDDKIASQWMNLYQNVLYRK